MSAEKHEYGPVTEYHGTIDLPKVLSEGIRGGNPKTRSNRYIPEGMREEDLISYTHPDREMALAYAQDRANRMKLDPKKVGVVGVRGTQLPEAVEHQEPKEGIFGGTNSLVRPGSISPEYLIQASEDKMKPKKKKGVVLIISVGPKMPRKPTDEATPNKEVKKSFNQPNYHYYPFENPMLRERRRHILNRLEDNQNAVSDSFQGTISPKHATLSARDKRKNIFVGATGREYETEEHRAAVEPSTETQEVTHYDWGYKNPRTKTEWAPPKPPVNPNVNEPYDEMYNQYYNVATGEPMDIAFQLLKRELSPAARKHKLEYDTKYQSSPKRVKYRVELNRERRRRGIYGSGNGKDVSHTEGGKLTLENEHDNRARHFKNRGTLRKVKVKK
tara:strand:- start:7918 stop:9078 length:1161 start_codon:yes stop_codon:yes gene_type:complete